MERTYTQLSLGVFALLLLSVIFATPVHAEEINAEVNASVHASGSMPFSRENRDELKAKMLERRTMIEQKIASGTAAFRDNQGERREEWKAKAKVHMSNLFGNMKTRMYGMIERLEGFIERIESRAEKMEDGGANIDETKKHLSDANTALENAKDILETIVDADVTVTVDAENPKEAFEAIREKIKEVHEYLKAAHTAIRSAIESLKQAAKDADLDSGASAAVRSENSVKTE